MSSARTVYGTIQTFDVTTLHTLASAGTTQWRSQEISNAGDAWEDTHAEVTLAFAATAPAGQMAVLVFADGRHDPASLAGPGQVTAQPDVVTGPVPFRLLARVPYRVTGSTVRIPIASIAAAFGGVVPAVWRLVLINISGAALAASGSAITWRGTRTQLV